MGSSPAFRGVWAFPWIGALEIGKPSDSGASYYAAGQYLGSLAGELGIRAPYPAGRDNDLVWALGSGKSYSALAVADAAHVAGVAISFGHTHSRYQTHGLYPAPFLRVRGLLLPWLFRAFKCNPRSKRPGRTERISAG